MVLHNIILCIIIIIKNIQLGLRISLQDKELKMPTDAFFGMFENNLNKLRKNNKAPLAVVFYSGSVVS